MLHHAWHVVSCSTQLAVHEVHCVASGPKQLTHSGAHVAHSPSHTHVPSSAMTIPE